MYGLLTAAALSISANKDEIEENSSAAIRLALEIEAYVDLDRFTNETGRVVAYSLQDNGANNIEEVLKTFPVAYISVNLNHNIVTITAHTKRLPALCSSGAARDIRAMMIDINGRCHTLHNTQALREILEMCNSSSPLRFMNDSNTLAPLQSNTTGQLLDSSVALAEACLRCIMTETAAWHTVVGETMAFPDAHDATKRTVLELGTCGSLVRFYVPRDG
ncbi:hypothetical protein BDV19DRAFT_385414 [Aspergillus venezuelensis]